MSGRQIKILDGSYGFQLNKHLPKPLDNDPLWSSKALITNPEAVIATHMDYIEVGVDIIETNTYQASTMGFVKYLGMPEQEAFNTIKKAVELAKVAVTNGEEKGYKKPLIAGSVGPYGAYLHDGSEYTGNYTDVITESELIRFHEPRIRALVDAGVDLLAIETIPSKKEALVCLDVVKRHTNIPAWVSFTCKNDGLSTAHEDNFAETAIDIYNLHRDQLVAVGVNCIAPHLVESLINGIKKQSEPSIPLVVYANSGENYDRKTGWDNNCERLEDYIPNWLDLGVNIIGGCCRVCADYMKKIVHEVEKWERLHPKQ